MLEQFLFSANAILPIIIMISLGYLLRKANLLSLEFLKGGNKLIFHVFLPVMVFYNVYNVSGLTDVNWSGALFCSGLIVFEFILGLIIAAIFIKDNKAKGPIWQATFRSNYAILGSSLAMALCGEEGLAFASFVLALTAPLFNIFGVISLTVFSTGEGNKKTFKEILSDIFNNAIIRGAILGILALVIRTLLPLNSDGEIIFSIKRDLPFIYEVLKSISSSVSAIALIILGGLFDFKKISGKLNYILTGSFIRLIFAPAICILGTVFLTKLGIIKCGPVEYATTVSLVGCPAAFSSAVMAEEMKADADLARQLVVWTSIGSFITIFVLVVIMRSFGLI